MTGGGIGFLLFLAILFGGIGALAIWIIGSMVGSAKAREYRVYQHPTRGLDAVKCGVSWPAFFLGWIWLFVKKLWGVAAFFCAAGFALLLAEVATYTSQRASLGMMFTSAHLAINVILWYNGNSWRESSLLRRGYLRIGEARAPTRDAAVAQVVRSQAD